MYLSLYLNMNHCFSRSPYHAWTAGPTLIFIFIIIVRRIFRKKKRKLGSNIWIELTFLKSGHCLSGQLVYYIMYCNLALITQPYWAHYGTGSMYVPLLIFFFASEPVTVAMVLFCWTSSSWTQSGSRSSSIPVPAYMISSHVGVEIFFDTSFFRFLITSCGSNEWDEKMASDGYEWDYE